MVLMGDGGELQPAKMVENSKKLSGIGDEAVDKKERTLGFMGALEENNDPSWRGKERKC